MDQINIWWMVGVAVVGGLVAFGFWARRFGRTVQLERCRELFRLQHERYEGMILTAAAATGKPRGLLWVHAEITGNALLTRNSRNEIIALVPVVIRFEPEEGSDMENVPAAREPRIATAVFTFDRGEWHTDGRVVFNLDPLQAAAHFGLVAHEFRK